ncbi:MAG: Mu transposase C-terminal domain-containing protein [Candidatus Marinarcus sp.]|uniref:Mu transposase C-terminal domain-containing protein n=1 Tax=Candidatus Marinarcus sp. TaxID=3100987 RepID=UPI003B004A59
MGIIDLKIGSKVFFNNELCEIIRIVGFNKVTIVKDNNGDILDVPLTELSSKKYLEKPKNFIEHYSEKEWNIAKERYEIIKKIVFTSRTKDEVKSIAKKAGYSSVTVYKWINLYEQTMEISSLVPQTSLRGKKGSRLDDKIEHIINQILEDLYLNKQRYGFKKIYNKIYLECKKLSLTPPHENTIRNRIEKIDPKKAIKKRYGHKASQQFQNYEGEFPEGNYPLEFIQIDHTPLDIIVVDKLHRKPLKRPYLTLAIDVYSRMITGIYVSLQEPAYYNVSQCLFNTFTPKDKLLRQYNVEGEWNIFGVPRIIGVDNGSDLVSSDMQMVCDEYGITLMKRPVARPQFGAHVERVLGTINKEIHNLAGTTFSNINEKGVYDSAKEAMFTVEELTQWIIHYIVNVYHKKYHHGIQTTPEEKYFKGIFGDEETAGTGILPPITDDMEELRVSLLPTEFRTVQKDGITLDGISYYSDVLRHWIGKKDSKKSKIKHKIKRDPLNIQKIYFYDPDLKEYFEVPYRKISAPVMTLWDLYASKKYLKDEKITDYNEDDIFYAYEQLEEISKNIEHKHKDHKQRVRREQKGIIENQKEPKTETNTSDNQYEDLFTNIQLFQVNEKSTLNE